MFGAVTLSQAAHAAYPEKPVRIVVPYAPGGAVDVVARKIAQKLTEQTKQSFFVENRAGATGTIGTNFVARAPADGYTLLAIDNTYSVLPYVFKNLPWNHATGLVPITVSMFAPVVAVVPGDSQFKDLPSLVAHARANPKKLTYGSGGNGSAPHFTGEAFQLVTGTDLMHVPYKGAGEAMTGLISGQIDMIFVSTPSAGSHVKGGKARALAISGTARSTSLPAVPTFAEAGLQNFNIMNWSGLAAPAGTPDAVVNFLHSEVKKALASPDVKEFLENMGGQAGGMAPADFARLIKDETSRWEEVARKANIERQ
ncbi:MAG TPA: tripartite tricarboxylate transporter substrate binding protein [Noviherbaspirillum sp.]|nr:tripartite tricarboxylate transporter substrate binding protein [Noviherbaspirillum sp.]